jgi:hypothetical protein
MTKFTKNLQREKRIRASPEVLLYMYDLAQKNWMKKSQNMPVCLKKMGLAQHNRRVPGKIG